MKHNFMFDRFIICNERYNLKNNIMKNSSKIKLVKGLNTINLNQRFIQTENFICKVNTISEMMIINNMNDLSNDIVIPDCFLEHDEALKIYVPLIIPTSQILVVHALKPCKIKIVYKDEEIHKESEYTKPTPYIYCNDTGLNPFGQYVKYCHCHIGINLSV